MLRLSCEYTHFLGLAAPLRAPLTRRRWDRGSGGEKRRGLSRKSGGVGEGEWRKVVCFSQKVARFRRKGVRFLSPAASFFLAGCVVCSRPSRCCVGCRTVCVGYRPRHRLRSFVPSRARYAHSASFRFSAFTARLFAFNRLIVRWLRVKDSPRKRVLNIFVIVCCTVYCG